MAKVVSKKKRVGRKPLDPKVKKNIRRSFVMNEETYNKLQKIMSSDKVFPVTSTMSQCINYLIEKEYSELFPETTDEK